MSWNGLLKRRSGVAEILGALAQGVATSDGLARATALPAGTVAAALVELELAGAVTVEEGVVRSTIAR